MKSDTNLINGYIEAYHSACKSLSERDPLVLSKITGSIFDPKTNSLTLKYLNQHYSIECSTGVIKCDEINEPVATTLKVLILHYLLNVKSIPLTQQYISFRDIKGGGRNYFSTFEKRAIFPLLKMFGSFPELLIKAGKSLGGIPNSFGDASVTIQVFEHIPVTFIVWKGDDEIQSSAAVLFDENINKMLPCEDIVISASFGVYELIKIGANSK